jgi:energy-coupling factor transporter ATP-binding protein EcfA2
MIRIHEIKINGIGPIKELELKFDSHFNIICGQNGIGKTTILDCLAQSFSINQISVKKTAGIEKGKWEIDLTIDQILKKRVFEITAFYPHESIRPVSVDGYHGFHENSNEIIVFKTHRDIQYIKLNALATDQLKDSGSFAQETISGSFPSGLKNWFVNRFLFSAQPETLDASQLKNYQLAKECFSILNSEISFSKVLPSFDILLHTPTGEIYFEYLSSGYKSCLAVLLGLIQEIELRFRNPSRYIKDFEGIVFIDELDLHLHPEWQAKIYEALKLILPKAQIFTSTHSPHIIQVAEPSEIIALTLDETMNIKSNPLINSEFGCQGWTVEEILTDVMGMTETRTELYLKSMNDFSIAVENDNYNDAEAAFMVVDKMLHPEDSLKKILKIQLTGLTDND